MPAGVTHDLALNKPVNQSSTYGTADATRAVDGNTDGNYYDNSVAHTNCDAPQPWWQVDLQSLAHITTIEIWNRTDYAPERLSNFYVFASPNPFSSTDVASTLAQHGVVAKSVAGTAGSPTTLTFNTRGRYVRVQLRGTDCLALAEVVVHGASSAPGQQGNVVVPLYPTGSAGLPPNTPVHFAWKPFKGAANYLLHLWLVKQNGSVVTTPTTSVTLSTVVFGKTAYTWNNHGFLPGTYDYSLLPEDANGNALAPWSPSVQITIFSS